ncbi:hypothetical protein E2C01_035292 [Portunus trituberculatus]|uniref:Uncharacterized protein n=1 Tax=Portunus trituberculatus TaxID=210409 RepID=A0A5B7F5B6_PORTR|nr:hypothetical protein [Portunus trituberculatus]
MCLNAALIDKSPSRLTNPRLITKTNCQTSVHLSVSFKSHLVITTPLPTLLATISNHTVQYYLAIITPAPHQVPRHHPAYPSWRHNEHTATPSCPAPSLHLPPIAYPSAPTPWKEETRPPIMTRVV